MTGAASAQQRITSLATTGAVHRAFGWLHLHQPTLRRWLLELVAIGAPTFAEAERAEAVRARMEALGLDDVHLDDAGNVLGVLPGRLPARGDAPVVLLSAHLDTVFPAGTVCVPREEEGRVWAPGACDNVAGLTALLGLAAGMRHAGLVPEVPVLFAANTGEEGEGNLLGMRHLLQRGRFARRVAAAVVLEGAGTATTVVRALGSERFRLSVQGPGGHSWADSAAPNPILLLARILLDMTTVELPAEPRSTLTVGMIAGGTSVNSIPQTATAQVDVRSTDAGTLGMLARMAVRVARESFARATTDGTGREAAETRLEVERIGDRPAAALPDESALLQAVYAVDRHLQLRTELRTASTDANVPLALGLPAVAVGTGGTCGGIHTLEEWYDPTGRELALRRVLLLLLDLADRAANGLLGQ